jgi:predicted nucleic acid-binding protein
MMRMLEDSPQSTRGAGVSQLPDPDDEMVLEVAINGCADAVVTYNATHFRVAETRFCLGRARLADIIHKVIES